MPIQINNNAELTSARVAELLDYNAATGEFTWKTREWPAHNMTGKRAGALDRAGYANIKLFGRTYKAHRLAWLLAFGQWPEGEIDHINRDRSDNRIANLRVVTREENTADFKLYKNNLSGIRGVFYDKSRDRWRARVSRNGKQRYCGMYRTAAEAEARYAVEIAREDNRREP